MTTDNGGWYPRAVPSRKPSPWWYFGRAIYVSRSDYWKTFRLFLFVGLALVCLSFFPHLDSLFYLALLLEGVGFAWLTFSLIGLYCQYGHPSVSYFERLISMSRLGEKSVVADIHIGTYRHSYQFADLLPGSKIYSIDCWENSDNNREKAIEEVRQLEPVPDFHPRIQPLKTKDYSIPLPDASCDAVVFGFGTHEIPIGKPLENLFRESQRILKRGGKALLFEHGKDFRNYLVFGPVVWHITPREKWEELMRSFFGDVQLDKTYHGVNLFCGTKE